MTSFNIKKVFSSNSDSTHELEVERLEGSIFSLLNMHGDKLIFKLNDRTATKAKSEEGAGDSLVDLHFEARLDILNGKLYLDVETEDTPYLLASLDSNGDEKISIKELEGVTISSVLDSPLIENHTRDADVKEYMPAEDVVFQFTPKPVINDKPGPDILEFMDIVSVGFDDNWNVISFICPQKDHEIDNVFVSGTLKSEVEVGEVGGRIDPVTGEGILYGDDLAWKFWGDVEIFGETVSISKDEAAFIPIINFSGSGGLLALKSIEKSAHGGGDIEKVISSYFVKGQHGNPFGIQKGAIQETVIQALNFQIPGFATSGTKLQWNIDLQNPVAVIGDEYINIAHGLDMHAH